MEAEVPIVPYLIAAFTKGHLLTTTTTEEQLQKIVKLIQPLSRFQLEACSPLSPAEIGSFAMRRSFANW